jgi:hypothetical protein
MERQVTELVASVGQTDSGTVERVKALVGGLEELLISQKLVPEDRRIPAL